MSGLLRAAAIVGGPLGVGPFAGGLLVGTPLVAQRAPYGPIALSLPRGTRALGMADAYVGGRDHDAIFYNPAQLAIGRGLGVSLQRYCSASTLGTLSAVIGGTAPIGVGIGVQYLDYGAEGDVPASAFPVSVGVLTTRGPLAASSTSAALGVGVTFKGVQVGAAAKYVEDRLANERAGGLAFDVGLADVIGPVTVGLAAQNMGAEVRLENPGWVHPAPFVPRDGVRMPLRITLGAFGEGKPVGPFDLAASVAVSALPNWRVIPAGGVELGWTWLEGYTVLARAGLRAVDRDAQAPFTLGAGVWVDRVALDYAWEPWERGGGGHRVGLRVR